MKESGLECFSLLLVFKECFSFLWGPLYSWLILPLSLNLIWGTQSSNTSHIHKETKELVTISSNIVYVVQKETECMYEVELNSERKGPCLAENFNFEQNHSVLFIS